MKRISCFIIAILLFAQASYGTPAGYFVPKPEVNRVEQKIKKPAKGDLDRTDPQEYDMAVRSLTKYLNDGFISIEEYNSCLPKDRGREAWVPAFGYDPKINLMTIQVLKLIGCFHPDTLIAVIGPQGQRSELTIRQIFDDWSSKSPIEYKIATMAGFSSENIIKEVPVGIVPSETKRVLGGPETKDLFVFALSNGRVLKLTHSHGVFLKTSVMIKASQVKVDDELLGVDGSMVKVLGITQEPAKDENSNPEGLVYNIHLDETISDPLQRIVFAEGVAVGDNSWQNGFSTMLGKPLVKPESQETSAQTEDGKLEAEGQSESAPQELEVKDNTGDVVPESKE